MEPNQNMTGEEDLNMTLAEEQNDMITPEPEQNETTVAERSAETVTEYSEETVAEQNVEKDAEQNVEKDAEQNVEKVAEQNVEKVAGQNAEQNVEKVAEQNDESEREAPSSDDVAPNHKTGEKKRGKGGLICAMVLVTLLAAGGIGFGVWAMMDGNNQKEQLNVEIAKLKRQNSALEKQVAVLNSRILEYEQVSDGPDEIAPPEQGEAEVTIEDGLFTIKNADGMIYTQLDGYNIEEIVSCDHEPEETSGAMVCIVETEDGTAKITYDYEERSIEYVTVEE